MSRTTEQDQKRRAPRLGRKSSGTRVSIRPTGYGWLYLLTLCGMLVGSANFGNNLGFLLTFLLTGMAVASILRTHAQIKGAGLDFVRAQPVFAGTNAVFEYSLRSPRDAPGLEVCFLKGAGRPAEAIISVDLIAGTARNVMLEKRAPRRGLLRPGPVQLASRQPFGLFLARRLVESEAVCLVYPAPAPGAVAMQRAHGRPERGGQGAQGGFGVEEFSGLRAYAPGDAMQRIAWKASLRGQGLLTKEFEGLAGGAFVLDYAAQAPLPVEDRLSRLCKMALTAQGLGEPFSLLLPGQAVPADSGERHLRTCLRALALFAPGAEKGAQQEPGHG
jgi:uncharacterized protein (DUF58 family)